MQWKTQGLAFFSAFGVGPLDQSQDMLIQAIVEKTIPKVPKSPGPKYKRFPLQVRRQYTINAMPVGNLLNECRCFFIDILILS